MNKLIQIILSIVITIIALLLTVFFAYIFRMIANYIRDIHYLILPILVFLLLTYCFYSVISTDEKHGEKK